MYIKFISWFKQQKKKRPNSAQTYLGGESENENENENRKGQKEKDNRKRPTNPNYIRNKQNKK